MFRSFQIIIIRELLLFLAKIIVRRTPSQLLSLQHIPTQHDMLPQHLVCKNELNCEYCNITLARKNEFP